MDTQPLQHLTEQSACVINLMLKVESEPRESEYLWNKGGASGTGRKLEYVLVSEDCTQYCEGICKRTGKEPKATENFELAKKKFSRGTVWKVSKVSLARQNSKYLGCSCKVHRHEHVYFPAGATEHDEDAYTTGATRRSRDLAELP